MEGGARCAQWGRGRLQTTLTTTESARSNEPPELTALPWRGGEVAGVGVDAGSPARGGRPGARAGRGSGRGWVSAGTRRVPCLPRGVRQAAGSGALSRGSAKGVRTSLSQSGKVVAGRRPGPWPTSFLLSAPRPPRGHPTVHLLFTFQKVRWRHQEVGRRHASGKQTSVPHPNPPVPGLWPGSCHVTAPGTTGPGNEVSFYSVSALLAKRTVAPNRISFLINKEERQRGCWVGEYQFPPRGPSPSVAMLPAVIVFVTGRPRPHLLAAFPSWKLQARALLISFTAEFSRPRGQSGL